jgi:inosine-uridine nucleoside N-ribohydrolase
MLVVLIGIPCCEGVDKVLAAQRIPVIFDTDIGDDIDDTWALALLLKCPEIDVRLVVGDQGRSAYRAKIIAKLLETAGRTDIPIGIGLDVNRHGVAGQQAWIKDYDLKKYPGKIHEDGVEAIIETIMESDQPITLLAVGPVPNIRAALEREPRIANKARFVGMHGSVRLGYGGSKKPAKEYNVVADAPACQTVFTAPWEMVITPLDTCGLVILRGEKYARIRACQDPLVKALVQNYEYWWQARSDSKADPQRAEKVSSTLFDTVAVYLVFADALCQMETLPIRVTDEGMTVIDPGAKQMKVATAWKDLGRFEDLLVKRLTGE